MPTPRHPARATTRRSSCPIACALDFVGDRWTMIVIRDLLRGCRTYGDFLASPEQVPTNLLADRLRRLEQGKFVTRELYQSKPKRYEYKLTAKGLDLKPVLGALAMWAQRHVRGVTADPKLAALLRG